VIGRNQFDLCTVKFTEVETQIWRYARILPYRFQKMILPNSPFHVSSCPTKPEIGSKRNTHLTRSQ